MRPSNAAFDSTVRPRKQSNEPPVAPSLGPNAFFLASESDLAQRGSGTFTSAQDTSPVRTLQETIEEVTRPTRTTPSRATPQVRPDGSRRRSTIRPRSIEELRHEATRQQASTTTLPTGTGILTPSLPASHGPSLPSSPKSFSSRSLPKSDDDFTHDDSSSQAVESEEEGEDVAEQTRASAASLQDSAPQLIMPSIKMPSRRPFTERGKQLGKFKVMVVGSPGVYCCLLPTRRSTR